MFKIKQVFFNFFFPLKNVFMSMQKALRSVGSFVMISYVCSCVCACAQACVF